MANPTTYFGWVMPTSSSLVTNLPADFNTFGQGVDTSLQDLLGGTTGQVLSKTSGTNMDFTWVTPTDQTPLTTKGDLFTFSTVDARLGVGANNTVLTADSAQSTGLKWATPAAGGKVLQVVTATTSTAVSFSSATMTDSGLTVTITPTLNTSKILILVSQPLSVSSSAAFGSAMQLLRGATVIYKIGDTFETLETNFGSGRLGAVIPMAYLDSPATTSATTYKTQGRGNNATPTITFQLNSITASIVAMEIGA